MKKTKLVSIILAAMLTAALFTACSGAEVNNTNSSSSVTSSVSSQEQTENNEDNDNSNADKSDQSDNSGEAVQTSAKTETKDMFTERDLSGDYDDSEATTVECSGKTFKVSGDGAKADGNVLTISQEGVYILGGTISDGRVVVEADDKSKVQIVLNGCSITSSDYSAIYVKSADKVFITLAENTENSITDGKTYKEDSEDSNVDSAVFSKSDLTLNGKGSLTVNGQMSHAIVSKDDLKIAGGNITVTSVGSAVCGKDSVRIADGTINITSGGDGIKSDNEDDADKGFVYIENGNITINSDTDGIQAAADLTIENGEISLKTGGGNENSSKTHTEEFGGFGRWGNTNTTASSDEDSTSAKGLKAGGDIVVNNGTITIDSADDSIHSNSNATISGGTVSVTSGDDGIHAGSALTFNGGKITVSKSYEGVEGSNITVNGGEIEVNSSDDGFNAAGGSDQSAMGGRMGQNSFTANSDVFIKITGGTVKVNADGDGLDSNNNIIIEGGTVYVDGPTNDGNGALDYETTATISGGTLAAVGSSGMAEGFSSDSTQASILYNLSESHNAGEKITLTSESGEEIVSYTAKKSFNSVNISSPKLASSGKYTLTVGDKSYSIEMTSVSYSNGGSGMGGMRGGMGGMQNGDMPGGNMQNGAMPGGRMKSFGENQINGNIQNSDKTV